MKDQFFNDTNRLDLVSKPSEMQVVCPPCMRGIVKYLRYNCLNISVFRAGFDGIEFSTDPHCPSFQDYLEYGVYSSEKKYQARKQEYLAYLAQNVVESFATDSERASAYSLKNYQRVWFYTNDDEHILLWATGNSKKLNLECNFFDDKSIIELLEGTIEGEIIYDPEADLPLVQSRDLPAFAPALDMDTGKLRFDGLYSLPEKGFTTYLRFFPNGKVVGANSTGNKEDVMKWLDEEFENSGQYRVWGGENIEFTFPSEEIEVGFSFKGKIEDNALALSSKNRPTSRKVDTNRFIFFHVDMGLQDSKSMLDGLCLADDELKGLAKESEQDGNANDGIIEEDYECALETMGMFMYPDDYEFMASNSESTIDINTLLNDRDQ